MPLVRCKVCGYIAPENTLGDKCPACGAPRAAFEPYADRVSERRRKMLNLHLHLMVVHFPQAFSVTVLALALSPFIFRGTARALLADTLKILSLLQLPAAAAAFGAGVIDGRLRFKSLRRSPILLRKLVLASLLFLTSLGVALLLWLGNAPASANVPVIILALIAAGCSVGLGLLGMKISTSEMPGD